MQNSKEIQNDIKEGKTSLGIEFGSTRIKAVLIDSTFKTIATGSYEWENILVDGMWTYSLEDIWQGLQMCYQNLNTKIYEQYEVFIETIGSIGFSGMMHGYLAFNRNGDLLVPFRTWRNATTEEAEKELTALFNYNIPQRWSIAHLYQAILDQEKHVEEIDFFTTLSGYIHWKLTDEKVLGIGDASGMFPIDIAKKQFDPEKIKLFNELNSEKKYSWKLEDILPEILVAGEKAGTLTEKGAKLLDVSGKLKAGVTLCPPEGDAGTGMVATNSVAERTGNVSVGTSVFAMIVLEKQLQKVHPEIDLVTTPSGSLVGMVHANNCSSDLNAWVSLFGEFAERTGGEVDTEQLYSILFNEALKGDEDCGGLLSYGYLSGENITNIKEGRPLFVRSPKSTFNLANFMRVHLFTAFGALKIGMDILSKEDVKIDKILGHGGLFKTEKVGQQILAAAMNAPISVMETASEGGAWGIALLASYQKNKNSSESLIDFLDNRVFDNVKETVEHPRDKDIKGFNTFVERYKTGLPIEEAAIKYLV